MNTIDGSRMRFQPPDASVIGVQCGVNGEQFLTKFGLDQL